MQADMRLVGTSAMGDAVLQALDELGIEMSYVVAVIGATGNVGGRNAEYSGRAQFPVARVDALPRAAVRQRGRFGDKTLNCQALEFYDLAAADIALFACGRLAGEYAPKVAAAGWWSSTILRSIAWKRMYR